MTSIHAVDRCKPFDEDFVRACGGRPDGGGDGDFAFTIWNVGETDRPAFDNTPQMHLVANVVDGSIFLEAYSGCGATLAVTEIASKATVGELLDLLVALKIVKPNG